MNKTMKKALAGLAFGLACAVCGTAALAQTTTALLKTPYMIYPVLTSTPGATTSMEVLWQDSGVPTTPDTLSWGTDSTYTTFIQNVQVAQYGHRQSVHVYDYRTDGEYYVLLSGCRLDRIR